MKPIGLLLSIFVVFSGSHASELSGSIVIDSEQQLKESRVLSNPAAKGTLKDPYVIQGYRISSPLGGFCLQIKNVPKVIHLRDMSCSVAEGGFRFESVKSLVLEDIRISKISGFFGVFPGGDGKDGIGLHLVDTGKVVLKGKSEVSFIYGGAGGAGAPGGGDAGHGGDAYSILVEGQNTSLEINDLEISYIYGGAGAAGGAGLLSQSGGQGGNGGTALALAVRGELKSLKLKSPSLSKIYGGAGGAGAVGAVSGGGGGPGGQGGSAFGVVALPSPKATAVEVASGVFKDFYGGAGAAGAAGAWGNVGSGGAGGAGGSGGTATVMELGNPGDQLRWSKNLVEGVFGGAGAAGGAGALGSMGSGGEGGSAGDGGHARVIHFDQLKSLNVVDNQIHKILGGAGGAGAAGGLGLWGRLASGGKGGLGGQGQFLPPTLLEWDPDKNEVSTVKDGLDGLNGLN